MFLPFLISHFIPICQAEKLLGEAVQKYPEFAKVGAYYFEFYILGRGDWGKVNPKGKSPAGKVTGICG